MAVLTTRPLMALAVRQEREPYSLDAIRKEKFWKPLSNGDWTLIDGKLQTLIGAASTLLAQCHFINETSEGRDLKKEREDGVKRLTDLENIIRLAQANLEIRKQALCQTKKRCSFEIAALQSLWQNDVAPRGIEGRLKQATDTLANNSCSPQTSYLNNIIGIFYSSTPSVSSPATPSPTTQALSSTTVSALSSSTVSSTIASSSESSVVSSVALSTVPVSTVVSVSSSSVGSSTTSSVALEVFSSSVSSVMSSSMTLPAGLCSISRVVSNAENLLFSVAQQKEVVFTTGDIINSLVSTDKRDFVSTSYYHQNGQFKNLSKQINSAAVDQTRRLEYIETALKNKKLNPTDPEIPQLQKEKIYLQFLSSEILRRQVEVTAELASRNREFSLTDSPATSSNTYPKELIQESEDLMLRVVAFKEKVRVSFAPQLKKEDTEKRSLHEKFSYELRVLKEEVNKIAVLKNERLGVLEKEILENNQINNLIERNRIAIEKTVGCIRTALKERVHWKIPSTETDPAEGKRS